MFRRTRYQQGSVQREKRHSGPDVWIFRWREIGPDGRSRQRKAIVGTVATSSTEASALKVAHALRMDANQQTPHAGPKTIAELVAHYRLKDEAAYQAGGTKRWYSQEHRSAHFPPHLWHIAEG
jgi:hypothetical protein